jgi:nitroreductase
MTRKADYPILPVILNRWSSRAMAGKSISDDQLNSLFEAARWAPSSYNNQPWHFIYAKRDTAQWKVLLDLLVPFNQSWAKEAAVLMVLVSCNAFSFNNKPSRTHTFDAGSAWENLALQGCSMGLVVHGMEGFDYERARSELHIPQDYTVEAMIVVGVPGSKDNLPQELRAREVPSDRKKIAEFISEGVFKKD